MQHLIQTLKVVKNELSKGNLKELKLLILDSIASVVLPALDSNDLDLTFVCGQVAEVVVLLKSIAKFDICVVVVNHATVRSGEVKKRRSLEVGDQGSFEVKNRRSDEVKSVWSMESNRRRSDEKSSSTNYSDEVKVIQPALGVMFSKAAEVRVRLENSGHGETKVILEKMFLQKPGHFDNFEVRENGCKIKPFEGRGVPPA